MSDNLDPFCTYKAPKPKLLFDRGKLNDLKSNDLMQIKLGLPQTPKLTKWKETTLPLGPNGPNRLYSKEQKRKPNLSQTQKQTKLLSWTKWSKTNLP